MAIITTIYCRKCRKDKEVTCSASRYPSICHECSEKEARSEKEKFIRRFTDQPTDIAIQMLAEELYALKTARHSNYDNELIG